MSAPRSKTSSLFGFHFGFQPSVTRRHLPAPTVRSESAKWLFWVTLGDPGCKMWQIENPRVGGSIPPLATIQISAYTGDLAPMSHRHT